MGGPVYRERVTVGGFILGCLSGLKPCPFGKGACPGVPLSGGGRRRARGGTWRLGAALAAGGQAALKPAKSEVWRGNAGEAWGRWRSWEHDAAAPSVGEGWPEGPYQVKEIERRPGNVC